MSQLTRQKDVIEYVTKMQKVKLEDIAKHFGVTSMTIRRDLLDLEEHGMLTLSRGVVVLNSGTALELSPNLKGKQMIKEKKRIAKAAAKFVQEGATIFLDSGTTVKELALELIPIKNITVITNSLLAINTLCNFQNIHLITAPGSFNEKSMSFCDTSTYNFLKNIFVDISFLAAESISINEGIMVPNIDDCECKKLMIKHSEKVVILADSSKMLKRSTHIYASFADTDVLITDYHCSKELIKEIEHCGTEVLTV